MAIQTDSLSAFFRQYERVLALLALLGLLISLGYLVSAGVRQQAEESTYAKGLENKQEPKPGAPKDFSPYSTAEKTLSEPKQLPIPALTASSFLTPERRFLCTNPSCPGVMIPWTGEEPPAECPYCHTQFVKAPSGPIDTDMDGMPDEWEILHGFDPNDPADADKDADGDGFTNLEEFKAGTNPRDPKSHPDVIVRMQVKAIEGKTIPIVFAGTNTLPDNRKQLTFNLTFDRPKTVWVIEGDMIDETGFKVEKLVVKSERRPDPLLGGTLREYDISTVTLLRVADGKAVTLKVGDKNTMLELEAILELPMDQLETSVSVGSEFEVRGEKYAVKAIDKEASTVIILRERDGKEYILGSTPSM